MPSSFETIDYRIRPAKAVERRMMAEAFLRLRPFASVESYRYIGMGSVYFSDFSLFHSTCGFETMLSIEGETDLIKQQRFRFNVPLGVISLSFGHSNDLLPALQWDLRSVVWMDYDGVFDKSVLTDLKLLAEKVSPGSVVCISVNAVLGDEGGGGASPEGRLQMLTQRVGEDKIPFAVSSSGRISAPEVFKLYREIMVQEIKDGLSSRNAGRPELQKVVFEQIMFFRYKDGALMLTLGWVFFEKGQRQVFDSCAFPTLPFFRNSDSPFVIAPPLLTTAEIREIDRCNDQGTFRALSDLPLPVPQVNKYLAIRRYWSLSNISDGG